MNTVYFGLTTFDYNSLPPKYLEAIKNLSNKINAFTEINGIIRGSSFETKSYQFHNFITKYTTVLPIWKEWYRLTVQHEDIFERYFGFEKSFKLYSKKKISIPKYLYGPQELIKLSEKHFPQHGRYEWPFYDDYKTKLNCGNLAEKQKNALFLLQFPTSKLSVAFEIYKETLGQPVCKDVFEKYKKNCTIYKNIQSAAENNNIEEWIKALWETKSVQFVAKNIECRLANEPWNSQLWLNYIKFLEINDAETEYIFDVYSRYCRLFLEDKKMKEKYQNKVEEKSRSSFDGISKFWIDLIKFEFHFNSIESAALLLHKGLAIAEMANPAEFYEFALEFVECHGLKELKNEGDLVRKAYVEAHVSVNPVKYSLNRIANAAFSKKPVEPILPFGSLVNKYLWNNFGYKHLPKIYQTCKYFYYKYRVHFVHNLDITYSTLLARNSVELIQEKLVFNESSISVSPYFGTRDKLHNLWITNALKCTAPDGLFRLADKIIGCNIKHLHLNFVILTPEQYDMIAKDVEILILKSVSFSLNNCFKVEHYANPQACDYLNIENLLEKAPNVKVISIDRCVHNERSADKLLSIIFQNKFTYLGLGFYDNIKLNLETFYAFLQKNLASNAKLVLYEENLFSYTNSQHVWKGFQLEPLKTKLISWEPSNEKPQISYSCKDILGNN